MTRPRKLSLFVGLPAILLGAALYVGWGLIEGAAFVVRAAGLSGAVRSAAELTTNAFDERSAAVPWRGGRLRARIYVPREAFTRTVLLVPGVHASGIDEPRLVQFARDLASMEHAVVAVEMPDLMQYRVAPQATDMIEDAARWVSEQGALAPDGRVGMIGISFAGGLSVAAASRLSIRDKVAFVLSFGGHGDLPRTLRYLLTGIQPDGIALPPHDYGVAIILLGVAGRVVPAAQVEPLETAVLSFLAASHLEAVDRQAAAAAFAQARARAAALPEPARTVMGYVNDRDVARLGPLLLPHVEDMGGDPALSPAREAAPAAPVYLLHGAGDNVVPAVESVLLAQTLRARGTRVRQLTTALITHAQVDRSSALPAFRDLVTFWAALLAE
jgi:dienelactone hydrolase